MSFKGYFSETKISIDEIFPRNNATAKILEEFLDYKRVVGIRGFRRTGKTTLLKYIATSFQFNDFKVAFIDVQNEVNNVKNPYGFIQKIDKEISYQTNKGEYFLKILPEMLGEYKGLNINKIVSEIFEKTIGLHSSDEPALIIFDEVQVVAEKNKEYQTRFMNFVNNLLKNNENLYVLFTGSQVRTFNEYMKVFQNSTIYDTKAPSTVVNLPLLSKPELEEFLERGFSDNGLQMPLEDYPDLVYKTLGGFIGYVSNAARATIQVIKEGESKKDVERKVLNERTKLFEEMKQELRKLDKSLGFETRGPKTTPSIHILQYVAKNPHSTFDDITSATLEKFQRIDEEYVKIVLEILEQVDLVHKHNEKYFTHKFIENYKRW